MSLIDFLYSSSLSSVHPKRLMDHYLRLSALAETPDATLLHARRRSDMKEVIIWVYKNSIKKIQDSENFLNSVYKYAKLKKSNLLSFGIDQNGIAFIVLSKFQVFSVYNTKNIDLFNTFTKLTESVCQYHSTGLVHGALVDFSFCLNDHGNYLLNDPLGSMEKENLSVSDDIYSLGAIFFYLATRNKLPSFKTKAEHENFINYGLSSKLKNLSCQNELEPILKKLLNIEPECRFKSAFDLLKVLKRQAKNKGVPLSDSMITDSKISALEDSRIEDSLIFKVLNSKAKGVFLAIAAFLSALLVLTSVMFFRNKVRTTEKTNNSIAKIQTDQAYEILKNNILKKGQLAPDVINTSYSTMRANEERPNLEARNEDTTGEIAIVNESSASEALSNDSYLFTPDSELWKLLKKNDFSLNCSIQTELFKKLYANET